MLRFPSSILNQHINMTRAASKKAVVKGSEGLVDAAAATKALGVSRNSAYAAAKSGELPNLRMGRTIRVPTATLRKMLGMETKSTTAE